MEKKVTIEEKENTWPLCPCCDYPLISTLAFMGAEWFCMKCKWSGGIFSEKRGVPIPEDLEKAKADHELFKKHKPHLWMGGGQKEDCDRCVGKEVHAWHLTPEEKSKCKEAREIIGVGSEVKLEETE